MVGRARAMVNRGIDWLIDRALRVGRGLLNLGRRAAGAVGGTLNWGRFRRSFTAGGEQHSVYLQERGGRREVMIASTPQPVAQFLTWYEGRLGANPPPAKVVLLRQARAQLRIVEASTAELAQVDESAKQAISDRLLGEETELSNIIRRLLSGERRWGSIRERYLLEGMVGTYASMPRASGDLLTPDHQPQAAVLKYAARQSYFRRQPAMQARAAGRHAAGGIAINLQDARHKAGRTWGTKGTGTKNAFIAAVEAQTDPAQAAVENRRIVVGLLRSDLDADVAAMRAVYNQPPTHAVWADLDAHGLTPEEKQEAVTEIRGRVLAGESRVQSQNLQSLI